MEQETIKLTCTKCGISFERPLEYVELDNECPNHFWGRQLKYCSTCFKINELEIMKRLHVLIKKAWSSEKNSEKDGEKSDLTFHELLKSQTQYSKEYYEEHLDDLYSKGWYDTMVWVLREYESKHYL